MFRLQIINITMICTFTSSGWIAEETVRELYLFLFALGIVLATSDGAIVDVYSILILCYMNHICEFTLGGILSLLPESCHVSETKCGNNAPLDFCPHFEQNLPITSSPHFVQNFFCSCISSCLLPQDTQNFAPGVRWVPHFTQYIPNVQYCLVFQASMIKNSSNYKNSLLSKQFFNNNKAD